MSFKVILNCLVLLYSALGLVVKPCTKLVAESDYFHALILWRSNSKIVFPLKIQVKTWFQNRRMKQKRKRAEDVERRTKLSFLSNLAYSMQHGFHSYPPDCDCRPPTYPDTPLVLRTELPSKYACSSVSPWSTLPYYPPPPYWGRYPVPYWSSSGAPRQFSSFA